MKFGGRYAFLRVRLGLWFKFEPRLCHEWGGEGFNVPARQWILGKIGLFEPSASTALSYKQESLMMQHFPPFKVKPDVRGRRKRTNGCLTDLKLHTAGSVSVSSAECVRCTLPWTLLCVYSSDVRTPTNKTNILKRPYQDKHEWLISLIGIQIFGFLKAPTSQHVLNYQQIEQRERLDFNLTVRRCAL